MSDVIATLFYRLKKSKLFWILLVVCAVLPLISYGFLCLTEYLLDELIKEEGISLGQEFWNMLGFNAISFITEMATTQSDSMLLALICTSIVLSREFTDGTMRNVLLANKSRSQMYFSYAVVSCFVSVVYGVTQYVASALIFGFGFGFGEMASAEVVRSMTLIFALLILSALYVGTAVVMILFCSHKQSSTIVLSLILCVLLPGIINTICASLDPSIILGEMEEKTFTTISWIPFGQYYLLDYQAIDNSLVWKLVMYFVVFVCGYGAIGLFTFKKADLK